MVGGNASSVTRFEREGWGSCREWTVDGSGWWLVMESLRGGWRVLESADGDGGGG